MPEGFHNAMIVRKARIEDLGRMLSIIEEARAYQLSYGNAQWADGYPSPALISDDIASGIGYVAEIDGRIAGSMALLTHDPAYDAIDGAWIAAGPYIAVHRLAFSDEYRGKGLFGSLISSLRVLAAEQNAASIRIDTDRHNPIMIHLLEKNGFISTGFVLFAGDRKLAYELPL